MVNIQTFIFDLKLLAHHFIKIVIRVLEHVTIISYFIAFRIHALEKFCAIALSVLQP